MCVILMSPVMPPKWLIMPSWLRAHEIGAEQTEQIRQASLLHDIGKIAISEQVLQKKERLTDVEFEYIKTHAAIGAAFLETSQGLRHLAALSVIIMNGGMGVGYPDRLHGEEIPFESRIVAICDAVEVMASDRPYRARCSLPEIIVELRRMSATSLTRCLSKSLYAF